MKLAVDSPKLDKLFEAMVHPKRRGMVNTLSFRPATVTQLADEFDLSLPAMHKHIRLMEKARLIDRKKVGRTNFVALNRRSLGELQDWIAQYHTEWGNDKETLDNYIASLEKGSRS
jgi:DNA-binding transcriptional ArsR family regulator